MALLQQTPAEALALVFGDATGYDGALKGNCSRVASYMIRNSRRARENVMHVAEPVVRRPLLPVEPGRLLGLELPWLESSAILLKTDRQYREQVASRKARARRLSGRLGEAAETGAPVARPLRELVGLGEIVSSGEKWATGLERSSSHLIGHGELLLSRFRRPPRASTSGRPASGGLAWATTGTWCPTRCQCRSRT